MSFNSVPLRRMLRVVPTGSLHLKGSAADEPGPGLLPAFSASGQDVWLPNAEAQFEGDGLVLSAVGARCGKVFLATGRWGVVANTTVLVPRSGVDAKFAWYLVNDESFWERGATAQPYVQMEASLAKRVPLPPLEEQRRIADFLDDQVTRIDQMLAAHVAQRSLIEDAFSSIVVELTTVGPEDGPRLRSTGLPWIPTVNESWRLVPARAVLTLRRQLVGDESSDFILLSLTKQGIIRRDLDSNEGKFPASFDTYQEVLPSDLVFCLFDVDETPRTVGLVEERGMLTGAYTRFEVNPARALPEFLYWFYIGVDNHKAFRPLYTGMRKTVQTDRFLSAKVPLPDLDVQQEVVQRIHEARDLAQQQLQAIGDVVERMQEYKRSLITSAVAGELDVTTARREVPV